MAADSLSIAGILLSLTAAGLIFFILRLQQRRRATFAEGEEYSGRARHPDQLMVPDAEALEELDRLLEQAIVSEGD